MHQIQARIGEVTWHYVVSNSQHLPAEGLLPEQVEGRKGRQFVALFGAVKVQECVLDLRREKRVDLKKILHDKPTVQNDNVESIAKYTM